MAKVSSCPDCDHWIESVERLRQEKDDLTEDVHHLQNKVTNLEHEVDLKDMDVDRVTENLAQLAEYVQELETALAEAHLMSKEDGPTGKVGDPV